MAYEALNSFCIVLSHMLERDDIVECAYYVYGSNVHYPVIIIKSFANPLPKLLIPPRWLSCSGFASCF
jgi:hypothetical protein